MRAWRPYREALSETKAIDELLRRAGRQFDPRVVDAFLAVVDRDESIAAAAAPSLTQP
jgi:response regulator RpfG family c-di-GMP phosphodiesterase